jgi:Na+/H+-translocating membrane pyrophosphatase
VVYVLSVCALPSEFTGIFSEEPERVVKNWHMFFCVASGLWGGLVIGLTTEYYTSNRFTPVQVGCALLAHCSALGHDASAQHEGPGWGGWETRPWSLDAAV